LCPLFVESFSLDDTVPEFAEFVQKLGKGRTLVRFDMRGTGLSDRNPTDVSHDAQVLDLEAVVASEGIDSLVLMAPTTSGLCGIAFTARNPDVVAGLILYGTTGRGGDVLPPETAQALILMAKTNWPLAARTLADLAGREEFPSSLARYTEWYVMSAEGEMAGRILEASVESDVMDLLPQISCPTLVLHRPKDPLFPFATGQALAAGIPGARLVPLPGPGHNMALGEPEPVLRAIEGFLSQVAPREESRTREASSGGGKDVRTILFTDVEGSTALTHRLGDAKSRDVLREHERIVREALKSHGGSEVKTMGDGFMASFSSATKALECAIAMQRAFAQHNEEAEEPIKVRVGLNAGEPIAEDDDLFGTAVNEAARITAAAKGGEILVANVVRELAKGKDFLFADRGETSLKGFEDPVRLYEARWRDED
jgi:class 3 adenylate cyclase